MTGGGAAILDRAVIATDAAPPAIGPYSQAIRAGNLVFLSGQLPLGPRGEADGLDWDAERQTHRVLANLAAVLAGAGLDLGHVVATTVYLADLNDFEAVNRAYGGYFAAAPPARATVQVARLPRDAKVEISAIAVMP